jgi:hypothetical protein
LVLDVVRGPAICGAVGGERSIFEVGAATPALRRRSPTTTPKSLAATFKARHHKGSTG